MTEMTAPYAQLSSTHTSITTTTLWDLYEQAARQKYGDRIRIFNYSSVVQQLYDLDFRISIESADEAPREVRRTIVDVNVKEYSNCSDKETDETLVTVNKKGPQSMENRYKFSTTVLDRWGFATDHIGALVMAIAVNGGSISIHSRYGKKSATTEEKGVDYTLGYKQQEKILVPPKTRVQARVTSYSIKYKQGYVLRFSTPSTGGVPVSYLTRCQQMFCCWECRGSKKGFITAPELLQSLPGFRNQNGVASFVQQGTLSWIGEGINTDKTVNLI